MKMTCLLVLLINAVFTTQKVFADDITISNGYIKEIPPGARNTAAYFTLSNPTQTAQRLISVEGNIADSIELHNHIMKDGFMVMTQVNGLTIEAESQAELKPGSYHVMIIGANQAIQKNSRKSLTLVFENGDTQVITLPVIGLKEALKKTHSHTNHNTTHKATSHTDNTLTQ